MGNYLLSLTIMVLGFLFIKKTLTLRVHHGAKFPFSFVNFQGSKPNVDNGIFFTPVGPCKIGNFSPYKTITWPIPVRSGPSSGL